MNVNTSHSNSSQIIRTPKTRANFAPDAQTPHQTDAVSDQVTLSGSGDSHSAPSSFGSDLLGKGILAAAGATPGLGALVNFVGSSSISRVPGYDKVDTLHSVGLITNVVGSAACLVNPVIGLPMLAASGIATVAAISEKSRRDQQGF